MVYLFREELAEAQKSDSGGAAEGPRVYPVGRLCRNAVYLFFRVATFGSAPAAATAVYLAKRGIPAATGTGISAILYMIHKLVILNIGKFLCWYLIPWVLLLFRGLASDARLLSCALVYRFVTYILPGLLGGVEILGSLLKKNHRKRKGKR